MTHNQLAKAAISARKQAYVPFSKFQVGAALLSKDGTVYTGCNVESAAYSPTCCAERTAMVKAVSEGAKEKDFVAIAVAGGREDAGSLDYCYPCGVCRQMLYELGADDMQVIVAKTEDDYKVHTITELLPFGFSRKDLERI